MSPLIDFSFSYTRKFLKNSLQSHSTLIAHTTIAWLVAFPLYWDSASDVLGIC